MGVLAINGGPKAAAALESIVWPRLQPQDVAAVERAVKDNYWGGLGDDNLPNRVFEREFTKYCGAKHGITVANGTVSLELSLRAGGIRPGDEVIVPAITFIASATAIVSAGALPVFADVDPDTCQISAESVESLITPKTRGIIVVHYGGYMADMDAITGVARKHGLIVVEDCAHAQGSQWRGRGAGTLGEFGSYSFQHSKSLSAGEGGIVLTDDDALFERAVLMMNIGRKQGQAGYGHYLSASNWRMGGLQAALLLSQFQRFPEEAEERNRNGNYLRNELGKIPGLKVLKEDGRLTRHGYYFAVIKFDEKEFGCSRDKFREAIAAEGADVGTGYDRPIYKEPAFAYENLRPLLHESIAIPDYNGLCLPNAEEWAATQITTGQARLLGDGTNAELLVRTIKKIKENVHELA